MKKRFLTVCIAVLAVTVSAQHIFADTDPILLANAYLQSKQDNTGKMTGFGGESQWAAIAFATSTIDIAAIKNPDISLKDYLLSDIPSPTAPATEWERRILAIVATENDPSNFGGLNYVDTLQKMAKENQLGDPALLNDDIFGLLALIASGNLADTKIKENSLAFMISHQASDGGFSWSADSSCAWCGSDGNDTAAALQALQAAKKTGMTHTDLDAAIEKAKTYLLSTQKADGGFGYDTFSDADGSSTAWAVMALNALDLVSSPEAQKALSWLKSNQEADGGFHWMVGTGSDTSTTSHAIIALSGKSWILKTFTHAPLSSPSTQVPSPSTSPSPLVIASPSVSQSPTPSPLPSPTPSPTASPTVSPSPTPSPTPIIQIASISTPRPQVLGTTTVDKQVETKPSPTALPPLPPSLPQNAQKREREMPAKKSVLFSVFIFISIVAVIIALKFWEKRKGK
jgi:hypothetical protein